MKEKYRFKRHESFYLREGWIEKAVNAINEGKIAFTKSDGVKALGIGSNMVKSLRYWLIATQVMDEKSGRLSEFGQSIINYDPYLDNLFTWWMIHINLVTNIKDAPVFNIIFNSPKPKNFNVDDLTEVVLLDMEEKDIDMSNSQLVRADVSVFVRSYVKQMTDNPEDNSICPLSRLNLMKEDKKGCSFVAASYKNLHNLAVFYSILKALGKDNDSINVDDLTQLHNSPIKVLNLDKNLFYIYVNELSHSGLITVNRTAGLNMIYLKKYLSDSEIMKLYFEGD
ncbi:MAG: DUF4007 family protein [Erysipelotrichaceae bacterium]